MLNCVLLPVKQRLSQFHWLVVHRAQVAFGLVHVKWFLMHRSPAACSKFAAFKEKRYV